MNEVIDETGKIYGHCIVLERVKPDPAVRQVKGRSRASWLVRCSCGRKFIATGTNLRRGLVTRCAYCEGMWRENDHDQA